MPLTGDKPELTYKANFKMYVPAMSNLSGEHGGITFDHGSLIQMLRSRYIGIH